MVKTKKKKQKKVWCPDGVRGCDGPYGRRGRYCAMCYIEGNWGFTPDRA